MNEDVVLLWPLLFEGQLHFDPQDPLEADIIALLRSSPIAGRDGSGWYGNRRGNATSHSKGDNSWLFDKWKEQACHR